MKGEPAATKKSLFIQQWRNTTHANTQPCPLTALLKPSAPASSGDAASAHTHTSPNASRTGYARAHERREAHAVASARASTDCGMRVQRPLPAKRQPGGRAFCVFLGRVSSRGFQSSATVGCARGSQAALHIEQQKKGAGCGANRRAVSTTAVECTHTARRGPPPAARQHQIRSRLVRSNTARSKQPQQHGNLKFEI